MLVGGTLRELGVVASGRWRGAADVERERGQWLAVRPAMHIVDRCRLMSFLLGLCWQWRSADLFVLSD